VEFEALIGIIFFLTEALMILQWGRLSDRIGRRPVLLTGLFGLGLSMICFGLSHTFGPCGEPRPSWRSEWQYRRNQVHDE